MKIKKRISYYIFTVAVFVVIILGITITSISKHSDSYADASTGVDIHQAIQQTAYSYYMHSPHFFYESQKANLSYNISPEDTTAQDINYITCSAVVKNIYYDLIGVRIPSYTDTLLSYGKKYKNNPEVIMYGETNNGHKNIWIDDTEITGSDADNLKSSDLVTHLEVGDILVYTGHAVMVYDLIRDENNEITDAIIIESSTPSSGISGATGYHINIKMQKRVNLGGSFVIGQSNPHYLFYGTKYNYNYLNDYFADGEKHLEGGIRLSKFTQIPEWKNFKSSNKNQYTILRFLTNDNGKTILNYHGEGADNYDGEEITLPQKTLDRLKYNKLYIEKTINVFANSIVEPGDQLKYQIKIVNNNNENYAEDLHIYENLSEYVDFNSYEASKTVSFIENTPNQISWNIGKLAKGEEVIINYTVTVKEDSMGKTVVSTGTVENIPSATISNKVSQNPTAALKTDLESAFNELKDTYHGKQLINEIYNKATGTDFGFTNFDIKNLVINSNLASDGYGTIKLNPDHGMYNMVLDDYWSSLSEKGYVYEGENIYDYDLKLWQLYGSEGRRADTIYEENFKTGDVLIYTNHDDVTYQYSNNNLTKNYITYENGEYAYIYIEGKGFVGVNFGADGIPGTNDDRNDFTLSYYTDNGLEVYSKPNETDENLLNFANYQTLFGKDNYVIFRPSMVLNSNSDDESDDDSIVVPNTGTIQEDTKGVFHNINLIGIIIAAISLVGLCINRKIRIHKVLFKK